MSTRPRALLIVPNLDASGGGVQRRVSILRRGIERVSVETAVFFVEDPQCALADPTLHVLGWTGTWSYLKLVKRLRALIRRGGYDVVMAFGAYPNFAAWFATRRLPARPVLILSEITRPHVTGFHEKPWPRRIVNRWLKKLVYGRGDCFAANSIDGIEESVAHFGVKPDRTRRLAGVIDGEALRALARDEPAIGIDGNAFTICASARFDPIKRLDTLLLALSKLPPDLTWRAIFLGEGGERANLEALARDLGIESRVRFPGWLANPFPVIAASSVYVHCSDLEGLSNAVLEAMFLRTPVVTSFCSSDVREMWRAGAVLGYAAGDHRALALHLEQLMRDAATGAALRDRAFDYCRRHDKSVSIADYEDLLLQAAERRGAGCGRHNLHVEGA